jgi:hypothetical protein
MADTGTDIACIDDADPRWSTCTGNKLVLQGVYHRLTTTSVLGRIINDDGTVEADPEAEEFGEDVRLLIGSGLSEDGLPAIERRLSGVCQRDKRVDFADCKCALEDAGNGKANLIIYVSGTSAEGPFAFVFRATSTTLSIFGGGQ